MPSKVQSQACQCISKDIVAKKVQVLKESIVKVYETKYSYLYTTINKLQQRVRVLQEMISTKEVEICNLSNEICKQKNQISRYQSQFIEYDKQLKSNDELVFSLYERLKAKEKEIADLHNDNKSVIQSSYSMSSKSIQNTFSIQIGQLFRNKPDEILQFIDSIMGVNIEDPEEQGDMSCVLVGRDNATVQKWVNANRSCLRRLIKDNEKRFRFILIHKPGKKKPK